MAEYYTKPEADALFAATAHTHALEDLGGELPASQVAVPANASALFEDAATMEEVLFSVADQLAGKAAANHTHEDLTVTPAAHTHAQSEVTGLEDRLTEIEADITALQSSAGSAAVTPMLVASMHLGKLDNNSGAEVTSASRICSDPFAVENGKSYWQVNDKAVNMYVLLYDEDEMFLQYLGNFASGAEIAVNNANAAYMRISSLVGEYDLTNEFRIYDENPAADGATEEEAFTQADADLLYAPIAHTHTGYAAAEHTHDYAAADHTHTGFAAAEHTHDGYAATAHTHTAADITGLPSSVDAYSKTEADTRFAAASHTHDGYAAATHTHADLLTEAEAVDAFAGINHTHSGYAAADHSHTGYAASGHTHTASEVGAAAASHSHTPASIGAAASSHSHSEYAAASHSHSGYASSGHTHSDYFEKAGGTITGETNFSGGLVRLKSVQTLFHSGSQLVFGSNNLPTRIGGSAISATKTITVDSDERLKENIVPVDEAACVALIDGIKVKTFNYIGNDDPCMGVIAQDLQKEQLAKFFVSMGEEGYLGVKAADLVFPLIAAVQALTKRVEELEGK